MVVNLIGISGSDYISKKDGLRKIGINLHTTRPFPRNQSGVKGSCAEVIYISSNSPLFDKCKSFTPPCVIELDYDISHGFCRLIDINIQKGG